MAWWQQLAWTTLFALMLVVAIGGNAIVMWIVLAHRRMRTVTNYFLVNLSVADLFMAIFNCIFNFVYMINNDWYFGRPYCSVSNFIANVSVAASVFTLTGISFDRCVDEMESIYQYHHFNQLFFSLGLFGSLFVMLFVDKPMGFKFHELCASMGYLVAIDLSMCYYSETIAEESARVKEAAYAAPWYAAPTAFRRPLLFIMLRASKPAFLTGAGVVPMTLQTFAAIVKLAYSAFTLLIQEQRKV